MGFLSLLILGAFIPGHLTLTITECGSFARRPEYSDIAVTCGTTSIALAILICPVIYTGYEESLLILNNVMDNAACKGTLDTSVTPPVVRFNIPLWQPDSCSSVFTTTSAPGTGVFSEFSNIQKVNISGTIRSYDPTTGTVTYNAELSYLYSCSYPLEYLLNNTQISVSSSSIAVRDNNGSFISTLNMQLYRDVNYTTALIIPPLGIELRTNIYVQVIAANLTSQYHVHLDRCFASISPHPSNSTFFNLFVPCSSDEMTTIVENGDSQKARFYFQAFRFTEQQNQTVSTYYLHCITRLCEESSCSQFKQCNRRRRDAETTTITQGVSGPTLLTSVPITTRDETRLPSTNEALSAGSPESKQGTAVGLGIAVGVLILIGAIAMFMAVFFYCRIQQ